MIASVKALQELRYQIEISEAAYRGLMRSLHCLERHLEEEITKNNSLPFVTGKICVQTNELGTVYLTEVNIVP